ncbi:hypothetical protein DB347_09140 [Opitutaceae bacterium EW11]|nr:hypothetical protein DB347_09140 [Opitutaceae bacterium EW11]
MHYLDNLAERLVASFEDEDDFNDGKTIADRLGERHTLVNSVRRFLAREVASGRLAIQEPCPDPESAALNALLLHEDWT